MSRRTQAYCAFAPLLLAVPLLGACASTQPDASTQSEAAPGSTPVERVTEIAESDTALFAAVVRAIGNLGAREPVRIDPRPLAADPRITTVRPEALADVPEEVVELRAAVLERMGIDQTDAVEDANCPGLMPPPGPKPGCPQDESYHSVITGLPRPGGAHWPDAAVAGGYVKVPDVDEREPGLSLGYWSMRVITKSQFPNGGPGSAWDYVFGWDRESGEWQLVEKVPLFIQE